MKNFGYCIWLTPDSEEDEWYSYTNGFEPHITILKYLNEEEAKKRKLGVRLCFQHVQFLTKRQWYWHDH